MSDQPLVSIIINCFNGEKYIRKALDSVLTQTYENWEIIFWDNQSKDKSAEIFKSYDDKRFKYFCAEAHSPILYKARNYALEKAKGQFVAFLDVDDWWLPKKLEEQIPLFQNSRVGVVYGNCWIFLEKKNKKTIYRKKNLPTGMILNDLLDDYLIGSPTYVIRKKYLDDLKYRFNDEFHIIGDFDLNIRLASIYEFDCVQSPVANIRVHEKNESLLNRNKEISELKNWYNEIKKDPIISKQNKFYKIPLITSYLETMHSILNNKLSESILMVIKYPFSLNKIKLIIALLLPNFILKKIKNY